MPSGTFTGDIAVRGRRFAHLATVRLTLSLAYLILELARAPEDLISFKTLLSVAFAAYAILIVVYRSQVRIRSSALSIQFGDLLFTVLLVLMAKPGDAALPLLLFYFVLAESSLLHSGREVLLVTAVILVFYTGWMTSAARPRYFSFPTARSCSCWSWRASWPTISLIRLTEWRPASEPACAVPPGSPNRI